METEEAQQDTEEAQQVGTKRQRGGEQGGESDERGEEDISKGEDVKAVNAPPGSVVLLEAQEDTLEARTVERRKGPVIK